MRLLVQWALSSPGDWEWVESHQWRSLPKKSNPILTNLPIDHQKGWICRLNVQGIIWTSDHIAVEHITADEVKISAWDDSPSNTTKRAIVWIIKTLGKDQYQRWNTRQHRIIYAEDLTSSEWIGVPDVKSWNLWHEPEEAIVRHGKLLSDDLWREHLKSTRVMGWRDFTEGVPEEYIDFNGRIARQKKQR